MIDLHVHECLACISVKASSISPRLIDLHILCDKVRDTKMMMNTVCRIYILVIVRNLKYVQIE